MSDTLSIENLPPSERERRLTWNYNANVSGANTQTIALSNQLYHFMNIGNPMGYPTLLGGSTVNAYGVFVGSGTVNAYGAFGGSGTVNAYSTIGGSDVSEHGHGQTKEKSAPTFRGRVTGPVRNLLAMFDRWQIADRDAALFLGAPAISFISDLRVGTTGLTSRDVQDRARLLMKIYEGVHSLLKVAEAERSWISSNLPALDNHTLLDIMRRGSLSDLILIKTYVDRANGR